MLTGHRCKYLGYSDKVFAAVVRKKQALCREGGKLGGERKGETNLHHA